jgi:hypothetical protein
VRDCLNKPQISSRADAEREAELTKLNGKLYTVAKAEFDKSCPAARTHRRLPLCDSGCLTDAAARTKALLPTEIGARELRDSPAMSR